MWWCCKTVRTKHEWKFSNGTTVLADSFDDAVRKMISPGNRWAASETNDNTWDVQVEDVIHTDIPAKTVTMAVARALWKTRLDSQIKRVATFSCKHVHEA
jgi:hypothetical protein